MVFGLWIAFGLARSRDPSVSKRRPSGCREGSGCGGDGWHGFHRVCDLKKVGQVAARRKVKMDEKKFTGRGRFGLTQMTDH